MMRYIWLQAPLPGRLTPTGTTTVRRVPYLQGEFGRLMRPSRTMLNVPNLITFARLALVPVTAYLLLEGNYGFALWVFLTAAVSDFLDGFIARRFNQSTDLGALLDPIADKLIMIVAAVVLASHDLLPLWLAAAMVLRDLIIIAGAVAYRFTVGHVRIAPTMLSKVNTFLEFTILLLVMAHAADWFDLAAVLPPLFLVMFATVLASGIQYMWVWGWKAARESRGTCRSGM